MPYPVAAQFSRQQVAAITRLPDDVLGYWMREGLLVPLRPSAGKGDHRSFDFRQVHLAALLGELRTFGVKSGALKSFADMINRGISFATQYGLNDSEAYYVANLAERLSKYRRGKDVDILDEDRNVGWRSAKNEQEIIKQLLQFADNIRVDVVLKAAGNLPDEDHTALLAYDDLVRDEHLIRRGVSEVGGERDEWIWYVWPDEQLNWQFVAAEGGSGVGWRIRHLRSVIVLSISLIVRGLWQPDLESEVAKCARD